MAEKTFTFDERLCSQIADSLETELNRARRRDMLREFADHYGYDSVGQAETVTAEFIGRMRAGVSEPAPPTTTDKAVGDQSSNPQFPGDDA